MFCNWTEARKLSSLPATPLVVAAYLADLADEGYKVSTIDRALAAIAQAHKMAHHPSPRGTPEVLSTLRGIHHRLGTAQTRKAPLLSADLKKVLRAMPEGLASARTRALLLVGWAGAFRRSELVALNVEDVEFVEQGLEITIRRSKTDQSGAGRKIGITRSDRADVDTAICLRRWLEVAKITSGPLFREVDRWGHVSDQALTDRSVARLIKSACVRVGIDPTPYSGHSLRSGFVTSAAQAGHNERAIMAQTGHISVTMLRRYIRDADLFKENAGSGLL
jgi:integrase